MAADPLAPLLAHQGVVVLDGGLATTLEARGAELDDGLWSAGLLLDDPAAIRDAHAAFLEAGADCLITASYQATFEGFARRGVPEPAARRLLEGSVELAQQARQRFLATPAARGRCRPLVAASVGPYGAYLADGSEYRGGYGLDPAALREFHRERFRVLAASGADLLACETIPDAEEARVLIELLAESPGVNAWLSFTLRDSRHLADGTELVALVAELRSRQPEAFTRLCALGVNCVKPALVSGAIATLREVSDRPIVVYPNSGELWVQGQWSGSAEDWTKRAPEWRRRGARLIGGCCRTGPERIRALRLALGLGAGSV